MIDVEPSKVVKKGRVSPGKMFLVDTDAGRIIDDEEVKAEVAAANPWAEWVKGNLIDLKDLPEREHVVHTPRPSTSASGRSGTPPKSSRSC
ncbi:glutamate synthase [NADPH] large chain [Arthrobacter sp. Hiyo4]|nr:glutamate synthase [NADPH] large chain [Arthrobacter sp. Hiyo4]